MKNKTSNISYNIKVFIKYFNFFFLMLCIIINYNFTKIQKFKDISLSYYKKYVRDCYKLKKYKRKILIINCHILVFVFQLIIWKNILEVLF